MPKPKIAIVYYSMYGHVRTLALAEKEGLEAAGCEVTLLKVPETLSDEVLGKMGAPGVGKTDEEASAATLADYDGFLFGLSARFGMASAQVKALLDSTGGLWQKGALVGSQLPALGLLQIRVQGAHRRARPTTTCTARGARGWDNCCEDLPRVGIAPDGE